MIVNIADIESPSWGSCLSNSGYLGLSIEFFWEFRYWDLTKHVGA